MTPGDPAAVGRTAVSPVVAARDVTKRFGATTALDRAGIVVRLGSTHGLVGRNGAGKSTLVAILTGLLAPDAGEVRFAGAPAPPLADRDAWRRLVACVYQKSTIIPTLTVAENLFLNRQAGRAPIRWPALRRRAEALLAEYDVAVDGRRLAAELTVEQRQLVEIARALSFGARFIVLDEPTAQLDSAAIERLFDRVRALQRQGVTFLFISHHLQEVFDLCGTVTVFRDARHVWTRPVAEVGRSRLVEAMTGEQRQFADPDRRPAVRAAARVVLAARDLTLAGAYAGVSLAVRAGEVVGLAGIGGSGRVAVAETLVGLRRPDGGSVEVAGARPRPGRVPAALRAGLGFLPQDRHRYGLVPLLSVAENATMTVADRLGPAGLALPGRRRALAGAMIRDLGIKAAGPHQPVSGLSGGNAQKVVLARAIARQPRALVLVSPTAGIDVRAKESVLGVVDGLARAGSGVLIVSDELDDLRVCDRVLVMFAGRLVGELPAGWSDAELVSAMESGTTVDSEQPGSRRDD